MESTVNISIIIPTYNSEAVVFNAINSILNQDYSYWEVWVIDGVSNDKTLELVREYAKKDSRISWISERDNGIYDAMNKGIKKAKGNWLYFLGSDDSLYNSRVLSDVSVNLKDDVDIVYGNVVRSTENNIYDGSFDLEKIYTKNICHQAIFIKKSVFYKIGYYNIKFLAYADWDHNMRWMANKKIKHVYIERIIANYNDNGFSSKFGDEKFIAKRTLLYIKYFFRRLNFNLICKYIFIYLKEVNNRFKHKIKEGIKTLLAS